MDERGDECRRAHKQNETYHLSAGLAVGILLGASLQGVRLALTVVAVRTDGVLEELGDVVVGVDRFLG